MKKLTYISGLLVLLLGLTTCDHTPTFRRVFTLSAEEMLQKSLSNEGLMSSEQYEATFDSDEVTLVDLRSESDYIAGHLPKAINIKATHILDKEHYQFLKNDTKEIILYGYDAVQANSMWMFLTSLGFDNVKYLERGYDELVSNIDFPDLETARYDYAAIFQKAIDRHQKEMNAGNATPKPIAKKKPSAKKIVVPVPKKVQAEEDEEGC